MHSFMPKGQTKTHESPGVFQGAARMIPILSKFACTQGVLGGPQFLDVVLLDPHSRVRIS